MLFLRGTPLLSTLVYNCIDSRKVKLGAISRLVRALDTHPSGSVWKSASQPLLPQLTQLDLTLSAHDFTSRELVDMVTSRWRSPNIAVVDQPATACLQSVKFVIRDGLFDDNFWEVLRNRQLEGLKIGITDESGDVKTRIEAQR